LIKKHFNVIANRWRFPSGVAISLMIVGDYFARPDEFRRDKLAETPTWGNF